MTDLVYILVHDDDGPISVHRTPEGAKHKINTVPPNGWEWVESLAWFRNGPYTIRREVLIP